MQQTTRRLTDGASFQISDDYKTWTYPKLASPPFKEKGPAVQEDKTDRPYT